MNDVTTTVDRINREKARLSLLISRVNVLCPKLHNTILKPEALELGRKLLAIRDLVGRRGGGSWRKWAERQHACGKLIISRRQADSMIRVYKGRRLLTFRESETFSIRKAEKMLSGRRAAQWQEMYRDDRCRVFVNREQVKIVFRHAGLAQRLGRRPDGIGAAAMAAITAMAGEFGETIEV